MWNPSPNNYFRFSFSSAIRNPTLTDQYLNLNVGPATLVGNLYGADSVITVESFIDHLTDLSNKVEYFNIDPIKPEKVKSFELGARTTLFEKYMLMPAISIVSIMTSSDIILVLSLNLIL